MPHKLVRNYLKYGKSKCSVPTYRKWFRVYVKKHSFAQAVKMAWKKACPKRKRKGKRRKRVK